MGSWGTHYYYYYYSIIIPSPGNEEAVGAKNRLLFFELLTYSSFPKSSSPALKVDFYFCCLPSILRGYSTVDTIMMGGQTLVNFVADYTSLEPGQTKKETLFHHH